MTRALWWHCFSGIAGDMALASLIDAGADVAQVRAGLASLDLDGWQIDAVHTTRAGVAATYLQVEVTEPDRHGRPWSEVHRILGEAGSLPERARQRALRVFSALAEAEAAVHGQAVEDVHFHEVGALDAIVDVVGTCLALELLDVDAVFASPVVLGMGTVRAAHGSLPNPAPAVVRLLAGAPVHGRDEGAELTTPTGAAILAALAESFGPLPPMTLSGCGYGAGSRDTPGRPNVLQALVGVLPTSIAHSPAPALGRPDAADEELVVVEANVDDLSGELLGYLVPALLVAGALDAWLVPAIGKKGRPVHVVSALVSPVAVPAVARALFSEAGTLGLRCHTVSRTALERRWVQVEVDGHPVRVKLGPYRAKAEHDDCVAVSRATARSVGQVAALAESVARMAAEGPQAVAAPPLAADEGPALPGREL